MNKPKDNVGGLTKKMTLFKTMVIGLCDQYDGLRIGRFVLLLSLHWQCDGNV